MTDAVPSPTTVGTPVGERGWRKLILALLAFLLVPVIPQFRALLPVDNTMVLLIPALAACALVGWWTGGRLLLAIAWVALAVYVVTAGPQTGGSYETLVRGWALLLAGAFGVVCLFGRTRPFFQRALIATAGALVMALVASAMGPVRLTGARGAISAELAQRNAQTMAAITTMIDQNPSTWQDLTSKVPQFAEAPARTEEVLQGLSRSGLAAFPALLALQSLAALALAWATYHRLSRARIGSPLGLLKDFRFNDQLVWGLIVGLVIIVLPTLAALRGMGRNLIVFFGALYALRGLGVIAWFLAPGALSASVAIGLAMLLVPIVNAIVLLAFMALSVTALGLGLGDTWADWRRRARPTA